MKLTSLDRNMNYNGWENYETWNVSLWIQNDQALNIVARNIARDGGDYLTLCDYLIDEIGCSFTPDGVRFDNPLLDVQRLNEVVEDA